MNERRDNIIVTKSYSFALEIIKIYKQLISGQKEFVMSKQLLRSGTSIGANIHEASAGESKKDFVHKLGIAVKGSREISYWLNLLKDSNYLNEEQFHNLNSNCNELIRILNMNKYIHNS